MIGGIFGPSVRQQIISRTFAPDNRPKPEPKKPGFFGQGGVGRAIAGTIGDVLLQRGGMAPIYGPTMQFQNALAAKTQADATARQQEWVDWVRKQEYERANPKPTNNDTVADFEFIRQRLGEKEAEDFLRNKANPPVYRVGPDGQFYRVDVAQPQVLGTELPEGWTIQGGADSSGTPPFGVSGDRLDQITMMAESGGNPNAVSPKGARGLMQVMPATARDPGFGLRPSNGTPQDDVRLGREYRAAMQRRYGGDPRKMWAAYNAGPGRVDEAIRKYGDSWLAYMPAETRNYVASNMRSLGVQ